MRIQNWMEFVILPLLRRAMLSGACVLLLAACGGDDSGDAVAKNAATPPADSAGPAFSGPAAPTALPADSAAPQGQAAAPGAAAPAPNAATSRARDSAMAEALKAPVTGPVNVQVLANYQLTMEGLRKLVRAGQNLGALQARRPELRDSMRLEAFDPNAIYEKLNSIPDVRDAIGKAGMTPREYATATAALMQAAMARQMRAQGMTPPGQVNENNVKFVEDNWAEIQQMMQAAAAQARPRS
jgi:hypothetical protein